MKRGILICMLLLCLSWAALADTEVTLTFGGDCVLATREEWVDDADTFLACAERNGLPWCFGGVQSWFDTDDLTLINLECVLQDSNRGHDWHKQHTFRGPTAYAGMLHDCGIDLVNLANNHFIDYGKSGQRSTREALDEAGMPYCGYQSLYVAEVRGVKLGFGGCRETVWEKSKPTVYRDIQQLKKLGCDVIIYCCHWGKEYSETHSRAQTRMAQYAVNSGADIVIGTHPHVVQGAEILTSSDGQRDAVVVYSLGNLVFGGTHELRTFDGMLARCVLRFTEDGAYQGVTMTLLPVLTSGNAPANDFRPIPAHGEDAYRIMAQVQADSGSLWQDVTSPEHLTLSLRRSE